MYANGAFKNPFADFDFTKFAGDFKFPGHSRSRPWSRPAARTSRP